MSQVFASGAAFLPADAEMSQSNVVYTRAGTRSPWTVRLRSRLSTREACVMDADQVAGGAHLRLVWPQRQGAGTSSVRSLAPEFPFEIARRGYAVGTKVRQAVLPDHDGPTTVVPVEMGDLGLEERYGIEAKTVARHFAAGPAQRNRRHQGRRPLRRRHHRRRRDPARPGCRPRRPEQC